MNHLMNNYGTRSIAMVRGEGAYLFDETGKQYLDFTAGIAVCSLGHCHKSITDAIVAQVNMLMHCSNLYRIPAQEAVASTLCQLSGLSQALFCNSGTEANEGALKLARKFAFKESKNRTKLLSLPNAFHGRTMGALSLTPKKAYQTGFEPLVPDCITPETLDGVLDAIDESTAACFVEMIQGEGGVRVLSADFLHELEAKLHANGALLVIDEVQTGVGRTGTFFAFEQFGLHPDIVTLAKGLGSGFPVGAILAAEHVASAFEPGNHGTTFGGNPLAMATALAVVNIVREEGFLAHVREMGEKLAHALSKIGDNVSGMGLMLGMDVPDARAFVKEAAEKGVLLTATGDTRVRIVPPLIIEDKHIKEFLHLMQGA
jgi:acetylornithine/N-succinyldiaminopimelate aminotransferase